MANGTAGQRLATLYVRRAALFGALWCIVPTLIVWIVMLSVSFSFRPVYLVRFAVTAVVGGALGALANTGDRPSTGQRPVGDVRRPAAERVCACNRRRMPIQYER
jgi:hypothetical protein